MYLRAVIHDNIWSIKIILKHWPSKKVFEQITPCHIYLKQVLNVSVFIKHEVCKYVNMECVQHNSIQHCPTTVGTSHYHTLHSCHKN